MSALTVSADVLRYATAICQTPEGTAAVIAPVGRFGYQGQDYIVGGNEVGPVAAGLRTALTDIQYGSAPDPYGWTLRVPARD